MIRVYLLWGKRPACHHSFRVHGAKASSLPTGEAPGLQAPAGDSRPM